MIRFVPIDANPAPRPTAHYTASSYACDRETRELGEDYPELKKVDRSYRLLERRIKRAMLRANARRTVKTLTEFDLLLADARHDASWPSTLDLARDAYAEARVMKIIRQRDNLALRTPR